MQVKEVITKRDLQKFIEVPFKIYKGDACWVPPLRIDTEEILSNKNPFWLHAKRKLFLAYADDGEILGRIAAIIDQNYIEFQNEKVGFFGFFECVDNIEAAKALFSAAFKYIKEHGIEKMMGPMNPSTNDEVGFLCENFDTPPAVMMPYSKEYYLSLAENAGLIKEKELYAYNMQVAQGPVERLERAVKITFKKNAGLELRQFNKRNFAKDLADVMEIYNSAWEKNWGFVPWTAQEFKAIAGKLKMLADPGVIIIASINKKPVGMLIALPDYNQVLKKLNGKLLPLGIFKFLYYKRKINALRLMIMGMVKQYRKKGIEAAMYEKSLKYTLSKGYKTCEFSWILDDNVMTQRAAEMMGGVLYKKYRVYSTQQAEAL
jgi:predicted GNAT family acetyltransferase